MTVRAVEGKKPYTGGQAIEIDENKVINLRLRAENNLIIYDEGDDEIYVDLQLPDEITPTDAFPVGVTTGRVIVDNGWDAQGTIICAKTTSGDNIKILYEDNGTLWMDNGTGTFKQIYFKADVDLITSSLQEQIDVLSGLGKFLSLWDCAGGEPMSFPLETPYTYSTGDYYLVGNVSSATPPVDYRPTGSEWNDTPSQTAETEVVEIGDVYIYDGTVWLLQKNSASGGTGNVVGPNSATDGHIAVFNGATGKIIRDGGPIPTGDVLVSDQAGNIFTTGMKIWGGTSTDYQSLTPDSNTAYLLLADQPTPPSPGWQPGVNTIAYYPLEEDVLDYSSNSYDLTPTDITYTTLASGLKVATFNGTSSKASTSSFLNQTGDFTTSMWVYGDSITASLAVARCNASSDSSGRIWDLHKDAPNNIRAIFNGNLVETGSGGFANQTWYHIVVTYGSGKATLYVNNVLKEGPKTLSYTGKTNMALGYRQFQGDRFWKGYISRFILEDKERTAQEIADYYDLTKSDYGIS